VTLPPLARQRRDDPATGGVLRPRTQPRATALRVSRTHTGRDVLRHGRRGAGEACVTRGRRPPSTHKGQSIGVLHGVPVPQCRVAPAVDRLSTRRRARVRPVPTAVAPRTDALPSAERIRSDSLSSDAACTPWNGENSRDHAQNVREDSSADPRDWQRCVLSGRHDRGPRRPPESGAFTYGMLFDARQMSGAPAVADKPIGDVTKPTADRNVGPIAIVVTRSDRYRMACAYAVLAKSRGGQRRSVSRSRAADEWLRRRCARAANIETITDPDASQSAPTHRARVCWFGTDEHTFPALKVQATPRRSYRGRYVADSAPVCSDRPALAESRDD
jgi:hypothetical protein